jgi:hypothetical protein
MIDFLFQKSPPQTTEISKSESKALKTKSSSLWPDRLRQIFDIFLKKISGFLEFNESISKVFSCMLSASFSPDGLRKIFDLFTRTFQDFFGPDPFFDKKL